MTASAALFNNPDPKDSQDITTYTVNSGDSLWSIAMQIATEEAAANQQTLSGSALNTATANELALIEQNNPQIVGSGGSGTYNLIYKGDTISVPVQTPAPGTSVPAQTTVQGAPGFVPPVSPSTLNADPTGRLGPGEDFLSANGKYDLVLLPNGNLVLYQLPTSGSATRRGENYTGDTVLWQSSTVGVTYAVQNGSNMDLYSANGTLIKSISDPTVYNDIYGPPLPLPPVDDGPKLLPPAPTTKKT
jgi:hypothetical protein